MRKNNGPNTPDLKPNAVVDWLEQHRANLVDSDLIVSVMPSVFELSMLACQFSAEPEIEPRVESAWQLWKVADQKIAKETEYRLQALSGKDLKFVFDNTKLPPLKENYPIDWEQWVRLVVPRARKADRAALVREYLVEEPASPGAMPQGDPNFDDKSVEEYNETVSRVYDLAYAKKDAEGAADLMIDYYKKAKLDGPFSWSIAYAFMHWLEGRDYRITHGRASKGGITAAELKKRKKKLG